MPTGISVKKPAYPREYSSGNNHDEDIALRGQAERARETANTAEVSQYAAEEWEKAKGLL